MLLKIRGLSQLLDHSCVLGNNKLVVTYLGLTLKYCNCNLRVALPWSEEVLLLARNRSTLLVVLSMFATHNLGMASSCGGGMVFQ